MSERLAQLPRIIFVSKVSSPIVQDRPYATSDALIELSMWPPLFVFATSYDPPTRFCDSGDPLKSIVILHHFSTALPLLSPGGAPNSTPLSEGHQIGRRLGKDRGLCTAGGGGAGGAPG